MRARQFISIWMAAMILGLFIAPFGHSTPLESNTFQATAGTGIITGKVVSGADPVKMAKVFCWAVIDDGVVTQSAETDEQGKYALEGLKPGEYYVVAGADGYAAVIYRNARTPLDAETVPVEEGQTVRGIDFNLRKLPIGAGAVAGRVTDEKTGAPIAGAWVIVFGKRNPFAQEHLFAVSDADGNYKIGNLANNIYVAAAYANNYLPEIYKDAQVITDATPIVVTGEVKDIDFTLVQGGAISGVVQTNDGEPMAGVRIHAEALERNKIGIPGLELLRQMTLTDAEGKYKISGLAEGNYRVSATACIDGFRVVKFFDDKLEAKDADPVAVLEGIETTGIDFTFTPATAKITGKVTDPEGKPLAGVFVTYVFKGDYFENWGRLWHHAVTDDNGEYELANLRAGVYFVGAWVHDGSQFKGLWYDNVKNFEDAAPIELADGQVVTGIDFVMDALNDFGSISGTVKYETTEAPVVNALVQAIPKNGAKWGNAAKLLSVLVTFTDENGKYKLQPLFKGDYHVAVRHNGYVEFFDDKTVETADVVTVNAGEDTPNIDFQIPETPAEGSVVSGMVTDEKTGEPIDKAMVTLFPAKRPLWFIGPTAKWTRVYYTTFTGPDGKYKIGGIPEGAYFASAWARGYIGELYDDTYNLRKAKVITLSGDDTATDIDFALKPAHRKRQLFAGAIAGFVQSDGDGVEQAMVFAIDENQEIVASAVTNPDGSYMLSDLENGDYRIMVSRPSFETRYYPNAVSVDSAEPVSVNSEAPSGTMNVNVILSAEITTSAPTDAAAPKDFGLEQNYPNPFNPSTVIQYRLPEKAMVTLQIFSVQGRLITTLVNAMQNGGVHQAVWNGLDQNGAPVPSGIYFYQIQANDFTEIKSLTLLK